MLNTTRLSLRILAFRNSAFTSAATVAEGEQFPAKYGRTGFRRNFPFKGIWISRSYDNKQVEAYAVEEDGWLAVFLTHEADMRLSYDPEYSIGYLRFHEKSGPVTTLKISDEMNIDIAPDGTVYGIEILNANEQLAEDQGRRLLMLKA
jgi:uncharacterized protein YuzE